MSETENESIETPPLDAVLSALVERFAERIESVAWEKCIESVACEKRAGKRVVRYRVRLRPATDRVTS